MPHFSHNSERRFDTTNNGNMAQLLPRWYPIAQAQNGINTRSIKPEDAVQEAAMAVLKKGEFETQHDAYLYGFKVIVNLYRNVGRKQQRRREVLDPEAGRSVEEPPQQGSILDRKWFASYVSELIHNIDERLPAIFELRDELGLEWAEIASYLQASANTVRSLYHRAIPRLRQLLADHYEQWKTDGTFRPDYGASATKLRRVHLRADGTIEGVTNGAEFTHVGIQLDEDTVLWSLPATIDPATQRFEAKLPFGSPWGVPTQLPTKKLVLG